MMLATVSGPMLETYDNLQGFKKWPGARRVLRDPAQTREHRENFDQQLSHLSQVFGVGYMNQKKELRWIEHMDQFLHSFLSSNMSSLRPLASISCHITSIHVFFGLPRALLTYPK